MDSKIILGGILSAFAAFLGLAGISDLGSAGGATQSGINFSDLCLWFCGILIVAALCCIGMAIYSKLYGDF